MATTSSTDLTSAVVDNTEDDATDLAWRQPLMSVDVSCASYLSSRSDLHPPFCSVITIMIVNITITIIIITNIIIIQGTMCSPAAASPEASRVRPMLCNATILGPSPSSSSLSSLSQSSSIRSSGTLHHQCYHHHHRQCHQYYRDRNCHRKHHHHQYCAMQPLRPSIINIISSPSIETPSSFCFVIMIAVQQSVVANAMLPSSWISYLAKYQVP